MKLPVVSKAEWTRIKVEVGGVSQEAAIEDSVPSVQAVDGIGTRYIHYPDGSSLIIFPDGEIDAR